ncbi:uncharacterized protein LOC144102182 [Amblyomma americanum]
MDGFTVVAGVTASFVTVWCLSEAYLTYIYSRKVVLGMVPPHTPPSGHDLFYGSVLEPCQEITTSFVEDPAEGTNVLPPLPLEPIVIEEEPKPPPYEECVTQDSQPPPYVESLPEE